MIRENIEIHKEYVLNEEYKTNLATTEVYKPLHSGKFKKKDGNLEPVMIDTIPANIKVRKILEITAVEKQERKDKIVADKVKFEADEADKKIKKASAWDKLKAKAGLTDEELAAIL